LNSDPSSQLTIAIRTPVGVVDDSLEFFFRNWKDTVNSL
jgi:hypothetical protein